jgi:hypothetical protein
MTWMLAGLLFLIFFYYMHVLSWFSEQIVGMYVCMCIGVFAFFSVTVQNKSVKNTAKSSHQPAENKYA